MDTRTIEIDFEVHKRIELERRSFSETDNDVLRRIFELPRHEVVPVAAPTAHGVPWASKGVELPHGTELRFEYNGRVYGGRIENGRWLVEGKYFGSPSGAAGAVAITKDGRHTKLDGWTHWFVKRPHDTTWVLIDRLRKALR